LNDTKKFGNILDFRKQQSQVDTAMIHFSGENIDRAKEVWLVESAPVVLLKYEEAVTKLQDFMQSKGLACLPAQVSNLKGDIAKGEFINHFKEVQRLKTQLEQYTDLTPTHKETIENLLSIDSLRGFKGVYIDIAKDFRAKQDKKDGTNSNPNQLDFELVLFASALIDFDYIMGLMLKSMQGKPNKQKLTLEQIIELIKSDAKFEEQREDMIAYINSLDLNRQNAKTIEGIKAGFLQFVTKKAAQQIADLAQAHGLDTIALQTFVATILSRKVFDGDALSDLFAPLALGWKARAQKETALMSDLIPILKQRAHGRDISGLLAYEK
jgi:type I restriction enzyme, R subunit